MKKIVLIALPVILLLIFLIFKIEYYSIITTILFSVYISLLFVIGNREFTKKSILVGVGSIVVLILQWYSISETIDWVNSTNNSENWSYGTDFLVILSWLGLLGLLALLNFRAYNKSNI
jgi:hypothetical protein